MREMAQTLHRLADACDGTGRPDCPILEQLNGTAPAVGYKLQEAL